MPAKPTYKVIFLKEQALHLNYKHKLIKYRDDAPALSTMQRWAAQFKRGRMSVENDPRSGRPATATTQENIDLVMDDRHLTVNQIANAVVYFGGWHDLRRLIKSAPGWLWQVNLALFEANPTGFIEHFLTQDECWVHHFEPETKRQSMQWKHPSSPPPKKAKVVSSAWKVMVSVFWNAKGIVGEYYAILLRQLQKVIKSKWPGKLTKEVLFHQDNAPAHKSVAVMAAVHDCGFELVDHPPYSPDLAPCDYFLFTNMKKGLAGKQYRTDDEVISAVEHFFDGQDESFYTTGIQA
uniref:Tc1-like transposase DDE domain-containing protein n=1 Tax=Amphilophus citrinellus TaxID=61819 RepID=A0A3Q0SYF5_AMPCI